MYFPFDYERISEYRLRIQAMFGRFSEFEKVPEMISPFFKATINIEKTKFSAEIEFDSIALLHVFLHILTSRTFKEPEK